MTEPQRSAVFVARFAEAEKNIPSRDLKRPIGVADVTEMRRTGAIREIADLVHSLHERRSDADADAVLSQLVQNAAVGVPGAESCGITIALRDRTVRTAAATDDLPVRLDQIQQRLGEGPCLWADWEHHVIRVDDMAAESRWPAYCRDALAETSIRSVLSFRLFAHYHNMGALNFYALRPSAFDDDAAELGLIFATHIALAWNIIRRDEEFRTAMISRDIIGQAKGMIMERFNIDALQAFELLKRLSQSSNTPLVTVARDLVESERRS